LSRDRGAARTPARLSQFAIEHLLLLPLGALIALVWANTAPEPYYAFAYAMAFAVNDIAMVFFFALMTKEVVEASAPGGVLHPWRRAVLPVIGAIGVTAIPALLHMRVVEALDEPMLGVGWPVTFATDIALSYFVARVIFRQHAAIPFLILLAIVANALGLIAVAWFDATSNLRLAGAALMLAVAMAVAYGLQRAHVRNFWAYLVVPGSLSWFALWWSGVHPAFALVPIIPFLPHAARDPGFLVDAPADARDALSQFERWWRYPAQLALFLFGLVNAGIPAGALEAGTWGLPIAVFIGKPLGLCLVTGVAVAAGLHLPRDVGWRDLIVIGLVAAIGFTVALFFSSALLPPGQLRSETSTGALITLAGAPLAVAAAALWHVGRFAR
jgi:Na+:H+ antiporter, NhaA family